MKVLLFILVFFLGANVLTTIGIEKHIVDYALILFACLILVADGKYATVYRQKRVYVYIIFAVFSLFLFRYFSGILKDSIRSLAVLLITPVLLLIVPTSISRRSEFRLLKGIIKALFLFFVTECFIAVIEFATHAHVFTWNDTVFGSSLQQIQYGGTSFRSVSLLGSPLTNALVVTILNAFIILSPLKNKYKLPLFLLGLVAVMAFNARMAFLVNVLVVCFYFLQMLISRNVAGVNKFLILSSSVLVVAGFVYLIMFQNLGDRLFKSELLDDSSGAKRIELFLIFSGHEFSDFLWGQSYDSFVSATEDVGLLIIENFWVCLIALFGGVFVFLLVIFYFKLVRQFSVRFSRSHFLILCISFIFLSSTNNSLFTQYLPLVVFLICLNVFNVGMLKVLLPNKYIIS